MAPKGPASLKVLENAMEAEATDLPDPVREMGAVYLEQIGNLTEVIEKLAADLEAASKTDEELRRLCTIPGIGPVTAGAVAAFAPDLDTFDSGRTFAASRDMRASGTTQRSCARCRRYRGQARRPRRHRQSPGRFRGSCIAGAAPRPSSKLLPGRLRASRSPR